MNKYIVFVLLIISCWSKAAQWQDELLGLPQPKNIVFSQDKSQVLILESEAYPDLPEPNFYLLGGKYTNGYYFNVQDRFYKSVELVTLDAPNEKKKVKLPGLMLEAKFSPDNRYIAAVILNGKVLSLWRYEVAEDLWKQWSTLEVNAVSKRASLIWTQNSQNVIVRTVNKALLNDQSVPAIVRKAQFQEQGRVYRDLLNTPEKIYRFKDLWRQNLVQLPIDGVSKELWTGLVERFSLSPDGNYLLIKSIGNDLHSSLKLSRQPRDYHIVDLISGNVLSPIQRLSAKLLGGDGSAKGSRLVKWIPNSPSTLGLVSALSEKKVVMKEAVDVYQQISSPFTDSPENIFKFDWRIYQWSQSDSGQTLFASWKASIHELKWDLYDSNFRKKSQIVQYDYKNPSEDPGEPSISLLADGRNVLDIDKKGNVWFYRTEDKAWFSASLNHSLTKLENKRYWAPFYYPDFNNPDTFLAKVKDNSLNEYWLVNKDKSVKLASWEWPEHFIVSSYKSMLLNDEPSDLIGKLYLPKKGRAPWPVLIWLYPDSKYKPLQPVFSPQSPFFALQNCVAVLDMTGQENLPTNFDTSDDYSEKLNEKVRQLFKLIKTSSKLDHNRVALIGHSYGANAVVSMLAASDRFKGGIARSGAYNRTLTPLGYQEEKSTLWEAKDIYLAQSPFLYANKIKQPLFIIHGEKDQNPGTLPIQSELLFKAVEHHNIDASILMLPNEGHNYKKVENLRKLLSSQSKWLKRVLHPNCD